MKKKFRLAEQHKAERLFRFLNYIIDFCAVMLLIYILLFLYVFLKYVLTDIPMEVTAYELENVDPLLDRLGTALLYVLILFGMEKLTNGRSPGKLITGTVVVKTDGTALTTADLLRRNFSRIVPFDGLSFLGTNGWHDSWSDTRVVKKKAYENARNLENDIQTIGAK
ncbi:RDD family protein [Chryseobacterium sp. MFBS3-17]|uniref:RDD family protein n=1 Tax=Chryseobacterium sp. MFBS3-17 TaxID=2886689 RepID=UPI001D0DF72B|nr:RDD family protein [Chryseobacterium sp. MFBS3-17]MCC2591055.1 RDD family protein [Chryseobacterium sp. MFBS3-17]